MPSVSLYFFLLSSQFTYSGTVNSSRRVFADLNSRAVVWYLQFTEFRQLTPSSRKLFHHHHIPQQRKPGRYSYSVPLLHFFALGKLESVESVVISYF
jgi:hypothetical protein